MNLSVDIAHYRRASQIEKNQFAVYRKVRSLRQHPQVGLFQAIEGFAAGLPPS
jgi:hypothetical protein